MIIPQNYSSSFPLYVAFIFIVIDHKIFFSKLQHDPTKNLAGKDQQLDSIISIAYTVAYCLDKKNKKINKKNLL
jgi:hypothetical protein